MERQIENKIRCNLIRNGKIRRIEYHRRKLVKEVAELENVFFDLRKDDSVIE